MSPRGGREAREGRKMKSAQNESERDPAGITRHSGTATTKENRHKQNAVCSSSSSRLCTIYCTVGSYCKTLGKAIRYKNYQDERVQCM